MNDLRFRVSHLEIHTEYIRSDIREIKPDIRDVRDRLTKLETTVSQLPGMKTIWVSVAGVVTAIGVFTTLQEQIRALLGLTTLP